MPFVAPRKISSSPTFLRAVIARPQHRLDCRPTARLIVERFATGSLPRAMTTSSPASTLARSSKPAATGRRFRRPTVAPNDDRPLLRAGEQQLGAAELRDRHRQSAQRG